MNVLFKWFQFRSKMHPHNSTDVIQIAFVYLRELHQKKIGGSYLL